ncbi:MAG: MBL fold metallo-hydrolase [Deltaproteobacteria bacterium]|nr:MBL fold metallo-hydrolase [Deltaproteobacteria bacterium]
MRVEILGCSGSVMKGFNTTSIMVNGSLLIDAGSAATIMEDKDVLNIKDILLTHSHIDHIKDLPFILESIFSSNNGSVCIWASQRTIDTLEEHVFNGLIWPGAQELMGEQGHRLNFKAIGNVVQDIQGLHVQAIEANHIPGALSFIVEENGKSVFFSGDTMFNQGVLEHLKSIGNDLRACFIETSFPDRMKDLARRSRHLTPSMAWEWIGAEVHGNALVVAYHIKPRYHDEVIADLPNGMEYITGGEVFEF